ncbi:MAG: hypothetical protein VKJ64_11105, partial [Leptolyngbyaceae bacterium]|nr:hypothetical protein [Leptolyngbyaceae bacterium]
MEIQSGLSQVIPPEIKNDAFYNAIQQIASKEDVRSILEIGSSSGQGSTEAFVQGILRNPSRPNLFCIEISRERFQVLRNHYKDIPLVKCYNVSSVSVDEFPSVQKVENFYKTVDSQLKAYPLEQVIDWLNQDIQYLKNSNVPENGIEIIREENGIDIFDVVLIDGSEFTGNIELEHVYGARYILLDDIGTFKNYESHQRLLQDNNYELIICDFLLRNGYSIFSRKDKTFQSAWHRSRHEFAERSLVENLVN